jgi:DNA end-binding protein Ku
MARRPGTDDDAPPRSRALWKGSIAFGLVTIPVTLHRAARRRSLPLHELHDQDGGRIRRRSVCAVDGAPVSRAHIVKGFQVEPGRWVTVSGEELRALDPRASRTLEITEIVDPQEIDPMLYGRAYWLLPAGDTARAYALLGAALARLRRVAVTRLTMRGRQHVAIVRPVAHDPAGHLLALSTLAYADDLLPAGIAGPVLPGVEERELGLAERLLSMLPARFHPETYHDEHRARVIGYLRSKAEGTAPVVASPMQALGPASADLFDALEASLAEAERHRSAA